MKKIQKKYYLSEESAKKLRMMSARSGFSQSKILEAVIVLHLAKTAK